MDADLMIHQEGMCSQSTQPESRCSDFTCFRPRSSHGDIYRQMDRGNGQIASESRQQITSHGQGDTDEPQGPQLFAKALTRPGEAKTRQLTYTGLKGHICNQCDKSFSRSSTLKIHQRVHTGEKPFKCDQCDYSTRRKCHLKSHIQSSHTEGNPYSCTQCEYATNTSAKLKFHIGY